MEDDLMQLELPLIFEPISLEVNRRFSEAEALDRDPAQEMLESVQLAFELLVP